MPPVLDIDSLLESPLADLHALAGELDIEGYRLLRKPDLTIAILETRGAIADEIRPKVEAKAAELAALKAERERIRAEREEAEEAEREAAREQAARERRERSAQRGSTGDRQRGGRRPGGRGGERQARDRGDRQRPGERDQGARSQTSRGQSARGRDEGRKETSEKPQAPREPAVPISGVFEPGSGGGGRLRTDLSRRVRADADVQRGEVRKWRLHRGDVITGEARKVKRGRTDFQLVGITSVNGLNAEQRQAQKVRFAEAEAATPGDRFARKLFKHAPVQAGSRVVITGPTRAAASQMIAKLAEDLAGSGVTTALVLSVARPEGAHQASGAFDLIANEPGKSAEDALQPIELVLERAKRLAEGGGNAAVLIDGLDLLPADKASEILGTSRNLAAHGSLTVIGSAGAGSALEAQATTIAVVAGGRKLKLDKKASWSAGV
ncbi:MAG: Rho termination factor N-terminal domain-containing protein [Actinobacteria bacterium]|nr:Rho termination factor N-terminal domain-containing protein [Actinomycetota bacterium]